MVGRGEGSAEPPCSKVFQGWFLSCPLSCGAPFCLPGFFPHPLSSLLNCVIIFKQINSIAEFSCPNDEFAAQMPLISHSPENQLMNSTGLSLERHLEQLCMAPVPHPALSPITTHPTSVLPAVGLRLCIKGDSQCQPRVECHRKGPGPPVLVKQS